MELSAATLRAWFGARLLRQGVRLRDALQRRNHPGGRHLARRFPLRLLKGSGSGLVWCQGRGGGQAVVVVVVLAVVVVVVVIVAVVAAATVVVLALAV